MATATPTNANPGQDPWELAKSRFLEDLEPHEKDIFNSATLENIYYSTSNANRDDAEKSKTRGVVRRLGPLVSAIESYGGAFDAFAQISPQYLSPIWGSIRVVLVVASSYSKFYDKIVDTLGRIGDILPRFRDYERIYNGEKHKRLTQALSNAYLDIITLCSEFRKTIRGQRNSKVRRILKPLAFDKEFDEAIDRFRQHRQNVEDEARTCHMIEAAEQRDAQLVLFAEERRRSLLARLSKIDSKHRHRKLKDSRHEGTGVWFTSCPEYQEWQAASQSSVLCCYGIPGCGKSVLVSSVIDSFNSSTTLIFYYCDYADKRTLEPSNVFATMARQALEKVEILPETLASEIEQADHDGERMTDPSKALILLQRSLKLVPGPIYLILDGLDEATESSQILICNNLKQLIEKSELPIKLFITGREELGPLLMLDPSIPFSRVPISSNAISLDIENYVRASTRRRISDGSLVIRDPDLEQLIVSELVNGAKGMFLWVEFQLHDLCEPESDHGIRLVLQNLPRSLGETYERLLSKIEGSERKDMIQRMFKWIVCAREPIHFEEMREAVAFTLEDLAYDPGKLPTDLNRLVRACGNLVIVDEETQVIQLAHHTVQQYLLQQNGSPFQFTIKVANVMAGEFCVAYLSFSNFESQVTRYAENKNIDMLALGRIASRGPMLHPNHQGQAVVRVWNTIRNSRPLPVEINMTRFVPPQKKTWQPANFGFLSYVVTHWLWHTVSFDVNVTDSDQESGRDWIFKNLVLRKQLLFEFRPWGDFQRDARESSSLSLLGWALMANHRYLIRIVASDIAFPSLMDVWQATCDKYFWGRNADQATLRRSHAPWHLNRLDLDYDSSSTLDSPNLVWLFSRFLWACREGHIDAIKEYKIKNLVNTVTADPLMPDNLDSMMHYLTVVASAAGHLQVVQFLCGKVIAPFDDFLVVSDLTKGNGLTAMEHAAISGHLGVVAYLADQGVRPRPLFFPGLYRHFFNEAINDNNIRTVESLLHLRSLRDIAMSPELVMSEQHLSDMLVKAITDGRTDVVRLLLNYGVNPNSPNEFGATPLIEAIRHSRNSIVSMLLEHDCLVDNTAAGMPLTIAAWLGNFSVARELILHGAAIFEEYFEIESMIDPACLHNEQVNDGKLPDPVKRSIRHLCLSPTPLYMACFHGHLSIVQLLLAYGAAANFPSLASLICLSERDGRFIVDSRSAWLLHHRPHFEPKTLFRPATGWEIELPTPESVAKVILYWDLPITAAISRGHEGIVSILLSSGALLPEEFDNLYHSYPDCVGSLQERLETRLANSLMTGSLPKTKQMRTSTIDMGMPRIPASRVRFVRELQVLDVGSTEVQQEHLNSRISVLKDEIQKSNPPYRDPLQATLVRAAENYEIDIVQALIHAGASLTIADIDNMPSPNPKLLIAAKKGNSILRHAFLDMTIAAAITYVDGKKKLCGRKELCQRRLLLERVVGKTVTTLSRNFTDIRIYCQILEVGVLSNDTRLIKDLYEILLFPFTELNPLDSALFAVVDYGKLSWVQILCKHGANINARDYNGSTPLLYAVERGATRLVIDGLLVQGADLKAVDDTGETVLYKAAASNEPQALDSLMQVSYCPDATDLDKALALCVSNGNPDAWANIARIVADEDLLPSYDISRARHLLQILCQHVEGLFELPAVRDEIEVPPQYSPPSGSLWSRGPPSQYIPTIGGNIVNAIFDTPKSQTPFKQSNVLESDRTMRDGQSSNQVSEAHSLRYTEPYIPLVGKENARIRGFGDGRWRNDIF